MRPARSSLSSFCVQNRSGDRDRAVARVASDAVERAPHPGSIPSGDEFVMSHGGFSPNNLQVSHSRPRATREDDVPAVPGVCDYGNFSGRVVYKLYVLFRRIG
jgi:hypothetical protein